MTITLHQFETIDGLFGQLAAFGDFETCADPRGYIRTSNRLLDACIDAIGYFKVELFASTEECAAVIIGRALSSSTFVEG
jgi:hypothetical protein